MAKLFRSEGKRKDDKLSSELSDNSYQIKSDEILVLSGSLDIVQIGNDIQKLLKYPRIIDRNTSLNDLIGKDIVMRIKTLSGRLQEDIIEEVNIQENKLNEKIKLLLKTEKINNIEYFLITVTSLDISYPNIYTETELAQFSDIVDKMQVGLYVYHLENKDDDRSLKMIRVNRASSTEMGFNSEDIIGKYIDEIFPFLRPRGIPTKFAQVAITGKPFRNEEFYYYQDNLSPSWYSFKAFQLSNDCVGVLFEDITEKKAADNLNRIQRDLSLELANTESLEYGLRISMKLVLDITKFDSGGFYLLDENKKLYLAYHQGLSEEFIRENSIFSDETPNYQLVMMGKAIYLNFPEAAINQTQIHQTEKIKALSIIPFLSEGNPVGCMNIASHTEEKVSDYAKIAMESISGIIGNWITSNHYQTSYRNQERVYKQIIETMNEGLLLVDLDGNIEYGNRKLFEMIGFNSGSLFQSKFADLLDEDNKAIFQKNVELRKHGFATSYELELTRSDQSKISVLISGSPRTDNKGKLIGSVVVLTDITSRKLFEQSLKESEERYSKIFNNTHTIMLIVNPVTAEIIDANSAALEYYGYTLDQMKNFKIWDINVTKKEETLTNLKNAEKQIKNQFVFKHKLSSGELRDVEVFSAPISFSGNNYLYSIIHDITQRRLDEESLAKRRLELERFETVSIGRELKMVELKKRIKELESQLSKQDLSE